MYLWFMPTYRTLDCREILCPGPVVEVSRAIKALVPGEVMEVLATDPGFIPDIEAYARRTGHPLMAVEATPGGYRALIQRGHQ